MLPNLREFIRLAYLPCRLPSVLFAMALPPATAPATATMVAILGLTVALAVALAVALDIALVVALVVAMPSTCPCRTTVALALVGLLVFAGSRSFISVERRQPWFFDHDLLVVVGETPRRPSSHAHRFSNDCPLRTRCTRYAM